MTLHGEDADITTVQGGLADSYHDDDLFDKSRLGFRIVIENLETLTMII